MKKINVKSWNRLINENKMLQENIEILCDKKFNTKLKKKLDEVKFDRIQVHDCEKWRDEGRGCELCSK